MQIDFHHAVTYVLSRWAGFCHKDAATIATAAQYVDDATVVGHVEFAGGQMYYRTASAHKVLDARNLSNRADAKTWVPFHFLPGNGGYGRNDKHALTFPEQLVCRHDSPIARDVLEECIDVKDKPYGGLHFLGICLHAYADTWAHQGFAGIPDIINCVTSLDDVETPDHKEIFKKLQATLAPEIGHGEAGEYPDAPFMKWQYINYKGHLVQRNNCEMFVSAAERMHAFLVRYNEKPECEVIDFRDVRMVLTEKFKTIRSSNGDERHTGWLELIRSGKIPHIEENDLDYSADTATSWKFKALGYLEMPNGDIVGKHPPVYSPEFLASDWKQFHDSLQYYRFFLLNVLLPSYGICAA